MSAARKPTLADSRTRRRAVTEFETNLVILAGAGTGKTSLLVERLLNMIGSGHARIDQIAAITFTERAAAEMRQRVADGLEELRCRVRGESAQDGSEAQRSARWLLDEKKEAATEVEARALRALESLDQARVQTIHAFCSELLRNWPLEAGVDPRFAVDSGDQVRARFEPMWDEFLSQELGPEAARPELWAELLQNLSATEIGAVAQQLAGFRFPTSLLAPQNGPKAHDLLDGEIRELESEVASVLERASKLSGSDEKFLVGMSSVLGAWSADGIRGMRTQLEANPSLQRKSGASSKKVEQVSLEELGSVVRRARDMAKLVGRVDEPLIGKLVEAVKPFALQLRESLIRQGWIGFDGLLALARDLLRDQLAVRRALKRRFKTLLVDEFQDVDPLQYEIVLMLAEREQESAFDPWTARLEPGRLFIVGDPKQSIYRFRGADYTAFRVAVDRVVAQGGAELDLVANFRSVGAVIDPVNRLFDESSTHWKQSSYQPRYEPIRPTRQADSPEPRIEIWTLDVDEKTRADERRDFEGQLVAREIERLHRRQAVPFRGIAVLFRTFSSIPIYLRPLRERGIPFVVDGGRDFLQRPEISQSLALLRTLAQPADPVALLALLRSAAGAASDVELAAWAADGGRFNWREQPDAKKHPRLAEVFAFLRRLHDETRSMPADAVVRRVLEATSLVDLAAAAYEGAQRVANLRKLGAAAEGLARDGRLSLEQVVDALQQGGLADLEADSPLADDAADAVLITSIHKMKGLESDWVVLPDLARGDKPMTSSAGLSVEVARTPEALPALAVQQGRFRNAAQVRYELEKFRHEEAEELRVRYVALTRARERLVLIASPIKKPPLSLRMLQDWGYDAEHPPADGATLAEGQVLHRLQRRADLRVLSPTPHARRFPEPVAAWNAARDRWQLAAVDPFIAPSSTEAATSSVAPEGAPQTGTSRDLGQAVGIVTHRALETWCGAADALRREAKELCGEVAAESTVDAGKLGAEVDAIVSAFLDSELATAFREVEILGREVSLLARHDSTASQAWRGSVDLVYRDRTGHVVVADYKTDREERAAPLRERYGKQLAIYAAAARQALGLEATPRCELWLLRSGRRVELDVLEVGGDQA